MKILLFIFLSFSYVYAGDLNLVCEDENYEPVASQVLSTNDQNNISGVVEFKNEIKSYRVAYVDGSYHIEILDLTSTNLTTIDVKASGDLKESGKIDYFHCMILD
jgi:hypothetical protein